MKTITQLEKEIEEMEKESPHSTWEYDVNPQLQSLEAQLQILKDVLKLIDEIHENAYDCKVEECAGSEGIVTCSFAKLKQKIKGK